MTELRPNKTTSDQKGTGMKAEVFLPENYSPAEDEPFMNERQLEWFRRLPLVGTVQAVGLTLDDMGQLLAQLYRNYFVDPRISVDFSADDRQGLKPWGAVTVLGRVKQPGVIALPPTRRLSVVAAIQAAGGFDTSADQANIRITSPDAGVRRVNLRHMGRRGAPEEVDLVDGDIVFVPESIF